MSARHSSSDSREGAPASAVPQASTAIYHAGTHVHEGKKGPCCHPAYNKGEELSHTGAGHVLLLLSRAAPFRRFTPQIRLSTSSFQKGWETRAQLDTNGCPAVWRARVQQALPVVQKAPSSVCYMILYRATEPSAGRLFQARPRQPWRPHSRLGPCGGRPALLELAAQLIPCFPGLLSAHPEVLLHKVCTCGCCCGHSCRTAVASMLCDGATS